MWSSENESTSNLELPFLRPRPRLPPHLLSPLYHKPITQSLFLFCSLAIITPIPYQHHILHQLLRDLGHITRDFHRHLRLDHFHLVSRQFSDEIGDLDRVDPFTDALDEFTVGAVSGLEEASDEFACVGADVQEGNPGGGGVPGEAEGDSARVGRLDGGEQVGHEEARHEV